jgi:hypothetical protein
MKLKKQFLFTLPLLALLFVTLSFQIAHAESDASKASASLKIIRTEMKKLKLLINKKGVRTKLSLDTTKAKDLQDTDQDGLRDILENIETTNSCVSDTDGDGISDGDEARSGSNPDRSDSSEVELTDIISALTVDTVTVGNYTFTATDSTRYKKITALTDLSIGDRVEISGRVVNSVLTIKKISLED